MMMENGFSRREKEFDYRLDRMDQLIDKLSAEVGSLSVQVREIKWRSGIWGAIGASIPMAATALGYLVLLARGH